MLRFALIGSGVLLGLAVGLFYPISLQPVLAQQAAAPAVSNDTQVRLDRAFREIQDLRMLAAAQAGRITNLERSVRSLQDQLRTPVGNRWKTAEGWAQVRVGMSRAEVENILGTPNNAGSVIDQQTLTYGTESVVVGTVTLVDDRVSRVEAPGFNIVQPEPGR